MIKSKISMLILYLINLIRMIIINDKQKDFFINENNEIKKINKELKLQVHLLESKIFASIEKSSLDQQKINILY